MKYLVTVEEQRHVEAKLGHVCPLYFAHNKIAYDAEGETGIKSGGRLKAVVVDEILCAIPVDWLTPVE